MLRTMQVTISDTLLQQIEQRAKLLGIPPGEFVQNALRRVLSEWTSNELERMEVEAYKRQPVQPGEFDVWETENFHHVQTVSKKKLGRRITTLSPEKMQAVGRAMCFALGASEDGQAEA